MLLTFFTQSNTFKIQNIFFKIYQFSCSPTVEGQEVKCTFHSPFLPLNYSSAIAKHFSKMEGCALYILSLVILSINYQILDAHPTYMEHITCILLSQWYNIHNNISIIISPDFQAYWNKQFICALKCQWVVLFYF